MRIITETDNNLKEPEIILRFPDGSEDASRLQQKIQDAIAGQSKICVRDDGVDTYLTPLEILFLETSDNKVVVHTRSHIYQSTLHLYQLEEMLPHFFLRISKSTIVNTKNIRSIQRNLTGASELNFDGTNKKTFVSRSYYKALIEVMEIRRNIMEV